MADDDDAFGGEAGRIGSERWRERFFRDLRLTMRDENQTATENLKHAMRQITEAAVESIRTSRVADTTEAIHQALDLKPDEVPELVGVVHSAIRTRRIRREQWGRFWEAVTGSLWEVFKHALGVTMLGIGGYLMAKYLGGWPH